MEVVNFKRARDQLASDLIWIVWRGEKYISHTEYRTHRHLSVVFGSFCRLTVFRDQLGDCVTRTTSSFWHSSIRLFVLPNKVQSDVTLYKQWMMSSPLTNVAAFQRDRQLRDAPLWLSISGVVDAIILRLNGRIEPNISNVCYRKLWRRQSTVYWTHDSHLCLAECGAFGWN